MFLYTFSDYELISRRLCIFLHSCLFILTGFLFITYFINDPHIISGGLIDVFDIITYISSTVFFYHVDML